ncbi:MAG TPA: 30S ribosomal protein S21 [Candidatus Omnitrophica bacterium]|nr:30S ribosomal protein S21 [Candidatus Omnitrophota bacterium]
MATVRVERGEPLDRALRRLKKQVEKEGLLRELREREYYEKPSQKRRKKYLKAQKKIAFFRRNASI